MLFDIYELDELICHRLSRHDLAQCAQVNKSSHKTVLPFLWLDLSYSTWTESRGRAFHRLVLEDYLYAKSTEEESGSIQTSQGSSIPALTKYSHLIRKLPQPPYLFDILGRRYGHNDNSRTQQPSRTCDEERTPSKTDLIEHLYKQCSGFQLQYLRLQDYLIWDTKLLKSLARHVLPKVHHLHIQSYLEVDGVDYRKIKYLVERCSRKLKELSIDIDMLDRREIDKDEFKAQAPPSKELKRLRLLKYSDTQMRFWSWLWTQCHQVEELELKDVGRSVGPGLKEAMTTKMVNITKIHLGGQSTAIMSDILPCFQSGLKEITISHAVFTTGDTKVLMKHCPTLEKLEIHKCHGFTINDAVQVLATSPNLCTLIDLDSTEWDCVDLQVFVNADPETHSLVPWACESSLKELRITIPSILGPGVAKAMKKYSGQRLEIQGRVYDRIARLQNLETLWLGCPGRKDCLEMSLDSGLDKLSGLKKLQVLNVSNLVAKIDVQEIQWMTEQWPRLHTVHGVTGRCFRKDGLEWMQKNHPWIPLGSLDDMASLEL
ncbi:hypothetical protein B0O80DRAFT_454130 [Mortierella sp. GBAus27b]|nr:hypothetical protein BGX31_001756 [Mortierella sp. GBA43]KAI8352267.1 hypothetical protein B0O80DRAFT_454130 [Mortierella sp. GBAus27b]